VAPSTILPGISVGDELRERETYHLRMDPSLRTATDELRAIARRVMRERGLLPDFSRAVGAEANAIAVPATGDDGSIRDLRSLPWSSIDNDDSRDLDQLT